MGTSLVTEDANNLMRSKEDCCNIIKEQVWRAGGEMKLYPQVSLNLYH